MAARQAAARPSKFAKIAEMKLRRRNKRLFSIALVLALSGEIALRLTPFPAELEKVPLVSTEFLDRTGRPLRTMLVEERRFARRCSLGEVSRALLAATLSAEDGRFRSHCGVDFRAIGRAVVSTVREGGTTSGASTITQQLVKLARPGPRTFARKFTEVWLALRVERSWSKDRILAEYLNRLDYGNLQTGIAAASRYYFDKPPSDLSAAEAAFLAGLPKAPSRLNPHTNFAAAQARQRWILRRMADDGRLDGDALSRALAEPIALCSRGREFEAPHFVDLLLQRRGLVTAQGGAIRTTLDLELNRFAEQSLNANLRRLIDKHATSGAVVVIDNPTGDVLALAGAGDYFQAGAGQINGAWMVRSPGSAMKPFTYLLALENGAQPCTVVADVPTEFATPDGIYRPNNYNHRFYGPVSLRCALGNSLNVAAIQTLQLAGGPEALQRAMRNVGITTLDHPADYYGLGLTLGNGEVRLLELANAFATLGRLGVHRPYRLLLRDPGVRESGRRVFSEEASFLVADMLADNTARAASFGLNSYLAFDFPVACKTGTSSDYRDNWTVGYTPEFTVAVWVGNPDGSRMQGITGVTGAAPVMHEIFEHLRACHGTSWFAPPAQIASYRIDPLTGRLADRAGSVTEKCAHSPEAARPDDYDSAGRVRLPSEYAAWLAGPQNHLGDLAVIAESAPGLRIVAPEPGSVYYFDGDLPAESQWIPLRADARGAIRWSCASLACKDTTAGPRAQIREGQHTIHARDVASGREVTTWIDVKRW
jgi:penicillin-binding protein 1C